jgi:sugar lactone lactonase YvrE
MTCTSRTLFSLPRRLLIVLTLLTGLAVTAGSAPALAQTKDRVFWTDNVADGVFSSTLSGNDVTEVLGGFSYLVDVAVDPGAGKMYFVDGNEPGIFRADLDGQNVEKLPLSPINPQGIALDLTANVLYYTTATAIGGGIVRADLDGSNAQSLTVGATSPRGIAVDPANGHLYWVESGENGSTTAIRRADLDGSNSTTLVNDPADQVNFLALDVASSTMYWTAYSFTGATAIQKANLDGTNVQDFITADVGNPGGIALDLTNQNLYWTDTAGGSFAGIYRVRLDGSGRTNLFSETSSPFGIALDANGGFLYVTDFALDSLRRLSLDGKNVETLVAAPLSSHESFTSDLSTGFLYLADTKRRTIVRAAPDGSSVETILTGVDQISDLAFDSTRSTLYWAELSGFDAEGNNLYALRRAASDGTGPPETLETDLPAIDLQVDAAAGYLYWLDYLNDEILRTDVTASFNPELVVDNVEGENFARSTATGTTYWHVRASDEIWQLPAGGSPERLVDGAGNAFSMYVDDANQKLYWAAFDDDQIRRVNFDGRNVEDVVRVSGSPIDVRLNPEAVIPVELAGFEAEYGGNAVHLRWSTLTETQNAGFRILRVAEDGSLRTLGFVQGMGTTTSPQRYTFTDTPPALGVWTYRLLQVDVDGTVSMVGEETVRVVPAALSLGSARPHPVRSTAIVSFDVPEHGHVTLTLYDVLGRAVAQLADRPYASGTHEISLSAASLPSGTYFLRLHHDRGSATQQVTIVR